MQRSLRRNSNVALALTLVALLQLSASPLAQAPAAAGAGPAAAILTSHKTIDDGYARAPMSPFTAVAVQYFEPGEEHRLGVSPTGVSFDPDSTAGTVIALTLEDGAFWVSPVTGAPPTIARTAGDGDVVGLPGTPVTAKTKLAPRDVVGVGRCLVEMFARPDTGNARVFDPTSPARKAFTGLKWYPPNLALQVEARFVPNEKPAGVTIATSRGLKKEYYRVGVFEFTVEGKPQRLTALAGSAAPAAGDELFVPFRDATTGVETYEVGRYLFLPFAGNDAAYLLDFNRATNPLCNYSPHYNCPVPPRENVITMPIRAGEMKYAGAH